MRFAFAAILFVAFCGTAPTSGAGSQCPGCTGAADPEATAIRVAEIAVQEVLPPEKPSAAPRRRPPIKEPGTWFNVLAGGEYWYRDQERASELIDYLRRVRPDVLHASIFGPELLGALPSGGGVYGVTPMRPKGITTVREYLAWWKKVIAEAHRLGIKVQATFSMTMVYDTPARDRGFFKYYNERWEADILGPKPVANPAELLQRDALGRVLMGPPGQNPEDYAYAGCPNSPHWRQLMKQMVKAGIEAGFDGFMVQFNYRYECLCPYCRRAFRRFLLANHTPEFLRDRLGIADTAASLLDTTRGRGPDLVPAGVQADDHPGPLELEAWQFTSQSLKNTLDEVFLEYGRSLKPDLMVSIWAHHRSFLVPGVDYSKEGINPFNERILLPPDRWGRGEDYIWVCLGQIRSRLAEHNAGDASLSAKFIYSLSGGKPFVMAKYDDARPRLNLAEAWAHRGIGLALDRPGFAEALAPYYAFVKRYRDLYHPAEPYADVALLFPRRAMYRDDAAFLTPLDRFARALFEGHTLFDLVMDQHLPRTDLSRYRAVLLPTTTYLSPADRRQLEAYRKAGGAIVVAGRAPPAGQPAAPLAERVFVTPDLARPDELGTFLRQSAGTPMSGCEAPWTVQMTAWQQPQRRRLIVHLVNYDRDEAGPGLENPRATRPFRVRLRLPQGARLGAVRFATPEQPEPVRLPATLENGQAIFEEPGFLVYGLAVVEY